MKAHGKKSGSNKITIKVRIDKQLLNELDEIAEEEKTDRASVIRRMLAEGIQRKKMKRAIELYKKGKVSLEKAAEIAGVSLWDMIEFKNELRIPHTDEESIITEIIDLFQKNEVDIPSSVIKKAKN